MNNLFAEPDGATCLDPDEIEGLLFQHVQTQGQLDELEQVNIQQGPQWLKKQNNADLLPEHFICKLHQKLFGQVWVWAGQFRKTEKNIGCDPLMIGVELRKLLDDCRFWVTHQTYPPNEIATRLHHRLVAIHLFPNGNGLHARILADALLTQYLKEKPIDWSGNNDLQRLNQRRTYYIQALREADRGNLTPLFSFISGI